MRAWIQIAMSLICSNIIFNLLNMISLPTIWADRGDKMARDQVVQTPHVPRELAFAG